MNQTAKHIIVTGKVQGVFFRKYTKQKADELQLTGWVKNTDNGDVEIFVQGDEKQVEALVQWCHQGSPRSAVEQVEVRQADADAHMKQFIIER